jgi:hypothetical protein
MADVVTGERVGGFVVLTDEDGLRHAVRSVAVLALSDADGTGSDTVMQLPGNRVVTIRRPIDEVLGWFC